jgi:hypothetical protein
MPSPAPRRAHVGLGRQAVGDPGRHPAIVRSLNVAVEVLTGPDHGHVQHDFLIKAGVLICRWSIAT